jgi:hypothetical protein
VAQGLSLSRKQEEGIHKTHESDISKKYAEHKNWVQRQEVAKSQKVYPRRASLNTTHSRPPSNIMSTAIAMAPSPAPHDRPSYVDIAPSASSTSPPAQRTSASATPNLSAQRTGSGSPKSASASKGSPNLYVQIYTSHYTLDRLETNIAISAGLETASRQK